jgi:hypothetical protein
MVSKIEQNIYRIFVSVFIGSLIFKLLISGLIPITGDEALFYVWSQDLSLGYYDHPPMIAWILAPLSWFSSQLVVVRLPASILNHLVALGIINLVIHWQPEKKNSAYKVGIIYLLLPSTILSVLVTNDSALFLFVALASYFFIRGEIEERNGINSKNNFVPLNYFACGAFLGMAFLSKYLAIFIAVSFFVILLYKRRYLNLLVVSITSAIFLLINFFWNINNCWQNILFNTVNRTDDLVSPLVGMPSYLLILIYLITPWLLWYLYQSRNTLKNNASLALLAFIPFVLFGILSFKQLIGLHWLPVYLPALLLVICLSATEKQLNRAQIYTFGFGFIHAIIICIAIFVPSTVWKDMKFYEKLSTLKNSADIAKSVDPINEDKRTLMTMGYSTSSIFTFHLHKEVPVFGMGSKFGRHDDLHFNFKEINGKNIRIFNNSPMNLEELSRFFDSSNMVEFTFKGVKYWYFDGNEFNYDLYRKLVLMAIKEKFYNIPAYLPSYTCNFFTKYELK